MAIRMAEDILSSLIADIEDMQTEDKEWFGPFIEHVHHNGVRIAWPELATSLAEAKEYFAGRKFIGDTEVILCGKPSYDDVQDMVDREQREVGPYAHRDDWYFDEK